MAISVYEIMTDRIVGLLEKGTVPWRRTWDTGAPMNIRGSEYRGLNVFMLGCQGYKSRYWLTFNQARELGGCVRKGEKATPVIFWKWLEKESTESGESRKERIPLLRYYNVFNVQQIDGLPAKFYKVDDTAAAPLATIPACEAIVAGYVGQPTIRHEGGRACYSPSQDVVTMPDRSAFGSIDEYFATLFHELGHSTGHKDRLAREGITDAIMFGSHTYSREELVAEMTAAFLCSFAGIASDSIVENSAAYVASWIKVLRGSPKLVVIAAAQAQKASDLIRGERFEKNESEQAAA